MPFNITDFNNKWANFKEELKDYFNKRVLDKNGDTMIGDLILSKDSEEDMGVVTKLYVDSLTRFTPGSTLLKKFSQSKYTQPNYVSLKNKYAPFELNSIEVGRFVPSTSGYLTVKGHLEGSGDVPFWYHYYNNGASKELTFDKDMFITYALKYSREGYEDIVLWSLENMSLSQAKNNLTGIYKESGYDFEIEIPVQRGTPGIFTYVQTCESFNSYFANSSSANLSGATHDIRSLPQCAIELRIGTGVPMFNLAYEEV